MQPQPASVERVLIVDDDAAIRETLSDVLGEEGYVVDAVSNGLEALRHLRSGSLAPSVILLDLMMPLLNGFEFYQAMARDPSLSGIPVIMLTASGSAAARARTFGSLAVLEKPIELARLLELLARCRPGPPAAEGVSQVGEVSGVVSRPPLGALRPR